MPTYRLLLYISAYIIVFLNTNKQPKTPLYFCIFALSAYETKCLKTLGTNPLLEKTHNDLPLYSEKVLQSNLLKQFFIRNV